MKKINLVILTAVLFVATIGIFVACNKDNQTAKETSSNNIDKLKNVIAGTIGYLDENDDFVEITNPQLADFFHDILDLEPGVTFNSYTVHSVNNGGAVNDIYVRVESNDGSNIKIASTLEDHGGGEYLMTGGKTCKCKSISCSSTYGCDSDLTNGKCICSSCEGDCEKESTTTSLGYVQSFFAAFQSM